MAQFYVRPYISGIMIELHKPLNSLIWPDTVLIFAQYWLTALSWETLVIGYLSFEKGSVPFGYFV